MMAAWFLSMLRSLLHPDALPWLKDPYDLEDESFRELWAAPLAAQLAGSVRSFVVVAAATVAAVHLPARLAARAGVLPLRFHLVRRTASVDWWACPAEEHEGAEALTGVWWAVCLHRRRLSHTRQVVHVCQCVKAWAQRG